jgi:NAD(P)-dependent dehydrogenase (short-subunit alcohol dehydrogenase family)
MTESAVPTLTEVTMAPAAMADSAGPKVAIVTGGASGIGEALCLELARRGARVIVADIDGDGARRVAAAIARASGQASAYTVDVSREPDVRHLVEQTVGTHGRLDYLFNNAGIVIEGDARDLTVDHWRRVLDVDLYGVLYGMLAAYPIMARQGFGHIVNTASAGAFFPDPGNAPYCTAKHALIGLSLSLRLEGTDLGVRVSAACPGYVRTNIFENASVVNMPARAALHGRAREQAAGLPRRMMTADQAAQVILDGVARNKPVILFPAGIRWARRVYYVFPRLIGRQAQHWHRRRGPPPAPARKQHDQTTPGTAI